MPSKQAKVREITDKLQELNTDELKQVRDYTDNRLSEQDANYHSGVPDWKDLDRGSLENLRNDINEHLLSKADGDLSSADESADDEKKKYIAQHMANPNAQLTAQDVPEPKSDEVKDLQNEAARAEHEAKGPAADGSH